MMVLRLVCLTYHLSDDVSGIESVSNDWRKENCCTLGTEVGTLIVSDMLHDAILQVNIRGLTRALPCMMMSSSW